LDKYHVGTAAHCVYPITTFPTNVYVGYGSIDVASFLLVNAISYRAHPLFNGNTTDGYDAAIVRLNTPFAYNTNVQAIPGFADDYPDGGDTIYFAGFGTTSTGGPLSTQLLWISEPFVDQDDCNEALGEKLGEDHLEGLIICGGGEAGVDNCPGDSGGPLFTSDDPADYTKALLLGINSFGPVPCGTASPSFYADVVGFAGDWFKDQLINGATCHDSCRRFFLLCRLLGVQQTHNRHKVTCRDYRRVCNKGCPNPST
jgi:trypsin